MLKKLVAPQDETFHVGQTQQYCRGLWKHWDPKITTFPGLYILGVAHTGLLRLLLRRTDLSLVRESVGTRDAEP